MATQNEIIRTETESYIASLDLSKLPSPAVIEEELLVRVNKALKLENAQRTVNVSPRADANEKNQIPLMKRLLFSQVAHILSSVHNVVRIAPSGKNTDRDHDLLAVYVDKGSDCGIYASSEDQIRGVARMYDRSMTINEAREVMAVLREEAPRVERTIDRDLVPVNNGVFDYRSKELLPFSPDYVFLSKARVDFDPNAKSPVLINPEDGTEWTVEEWIRDLFWTDGDDEFNARNEGLEDLVWKIMGAIIRPGVSWKVSAWFHSNQGNNGKGTLVELMRNLVGAASYASIPIADFGKDFLLEPLTRASAILVDENDVGGFIDRVGNLKAVITNDVISINRKYKSPISYQFWGFMVQCLNEYPRIKDKSESFYRRQLFVPFTKSFTGAERKYIKDDYMRRDDVLKYVLKHVLTVVPDYYELPRPEATELALAEYKIENDPVRAFWSEFEDEFVWDLLPFTFLYDLFKSWFGKTNPSGNPVGYRTFMTDLESLMRSVPEWSFDRSAKIRPVKKMSQPEPLIAKYQLVDWFNSMYSGKDPLKLSTPDQLAASYRGVQRVVASAAQVVAAGGSALLPFAEEEGQPPSEER